MCLLPHPVILVDDREKTSPLLNELLQDERIQVQMTRLKTGDYQLSGSILVERKTLRDFAHSLCDGRLFSQANRLIKSPLCPLLLLEGEEKDWETVHVSRSALQGALVTLQVVMGLPLIHSQNPVESAQWLILAATQASRARRKSLQRPGWRPKGKTARQIYILQGLPGIGRERAQRLLEHFGSVKRTLEASEEEWMRIPGIGPGLASKMQEILN